MANFGVTASQLPVPDGVVTDVVTSSAMAALLLEMVTGTEPGDAGLGALLLSDAGEEFVPRSRLASRLSEVTMSRLA